MLKPVKPTLDDTKNNVVLNYYQFKSLLENACSTNNLIDITKDYDITQDTKDLLHMIETIYPLLKERSLKNRQTTIAAKNDSSTTVHFPNWFSDTENVSL